jgi:hypothetical protein
MLQLFSMIKSEDGIKRRGDFFWFVVDFSFEKDTIGHIFTGQYYGLHKTIQSFRLLVKIKYRSMFYFLKTAHIISSVKCKIGSRQNMNHVWGWGGGINKI